MQFDLVLFIYRKALFYFFLKRVANGIPLFTSCSPASIVTQLISVLLTPFSRQLPYHLFRLRCFAPPRMETVRNS